MLTNFLSSFRSDTNYDTLLVLVTWYSAEYDKSGKVWEENTTAIGMGAIIDSSGNWNFQCDFKIINKFDGKFIGYGSGGTYWLTGSDAGGNQCQELEIHLKRLIIKGGYLKSDKSLDPTFWERLYSDDDIWKSKASK